MNKNLKISLLMCLALGTSRCTHKEVREPASIPKVLAGVETSILSEMMGGDSPLNSYRHPLSVRFHVNGDKKYLSTTARKALNEALTKTLGTDDPEKGFAKLAAGNIKDALIANFIMTMRFYKLINTGLQVDLAFLPEANQVKSFAAELNSNQLVRLDEIGSLSSKWNKIENISETNAIYNNSVLIPAKTGQAEYISGMISFYIEILDSSPKLGLPSLRKNGVKGFVRYRRIYRSNKDFAKSMACDNYVLSSKNSNSQTSQFFTVDLYKNFNLENLIPTQETLEVSPGVLVASNEGRVELLPDSYEKTGKSLLTSNFVVEQKSGTKEPVSFMLKRIVFDLKQGGLDREKTLSEIVGYSYPPGGQAITGQHPMVTSAGAEYLKKCEASMKNFFSFESLFKGGVL